MQHSYQYAFLGKSNHQKSTVVLERLIENNFLNSHNTIVITQDPEGGILGKIAKTKNINVFTANNNKDLIGILENNCVDYLISCGWHLKISQKVLDLPNKVSINCHSSFLPDYKGALGNVHAWANHEDYSGATVHIMDQDFDTGNILAQSKVKIFLLDTPTAVLYRIAEHTAILIMNAILKFENGEVGYQQQGGRYFKKIPFYKACIHRCYNMFAKAFNLPIWITPHQSQQ